MLRPRRAADHADHRDTRADERKDRRGMVQKSRVQEAIDGGQGVLRLEPSWVPRSFM